MPKQVISVLVKSILQNLGQMFFQLTKMYCFLTFVSVDKRFIVTQHLKTEKHKRAVKRVKNRLDTCKILTQQFITDAIKKSIFSHDHCETLMSANIALNKLYFINRYFKEFLSKYTGKDIPSESTLRKGYVDKIYENQIKKIRDNIQNKCIWVSIDETTDSTGRYVANVVIGILNETWSICQLFYRLMNLPRAHPRGGG